VIDGEAVILGIDGIAGLQRAPFRQQNGEVQLCAFDVVAIDGDDVHDLPLSMRKANLDRLIRGRPDGIFVNPFEIGSIGPENIGFQFELFPFPWGEGRANSLNFHRRRCGLCFGGSVPVNARYHAASDCRSALAAARSDCPR
jgi:hypothetical protein